MCRVLPLPVFFRQRDSMKGWMSRLLGTSWTCVPFKKVRRTAFTVNSSVYRLILRGPFIHGIATSALFVGGVYFFRGGSICHLFISCSAKAANDSLELTLNQHASTDSTRRMSNPSSRALRISSLACASPRTFHSSEAQRRRSAGQASKRSAACLRPLQRHVRRHMRSVAHTANLLVRKGSEAPGGGSARLP